jgi:hypothetical protein
MRRVPALDVAVELMHFPSQAPLIRAAPLPEGVLILLRVAAGDAEAVREAGARAGRTRQVVREAAVFFIEQIMLYPHADSYRVLGAGPEATYRELRRNMALLLRWLHPDLARRDERSVFAARVTRAWNDLKTLERRAAYDQLQRMAPAAKSRPRARGPASVQSKVMSNRRLHKSGPDGRYIKFRQSRNHNLALLRQVLLLLFGKVRA